MEIINMSRLSEWLSFQKHECGVLTGPDASKFLNVPRTTLHEWKLARRVAFFERHGRVYYGMNSLRQWKAIRGCYLGHNASRNTKANSSTS